jgi:hypothetical protein
MRERNLLQDRIELLGSVQPSDVRDVSHSTMNSATTVLNILQTHPGPRSRAHLPQHLTDRVVRNRHPRGGVCRALRRLHPSRRRARGAPTRHDLVRKTRR